MVKKYSLPLILLLIGWALWSSPDFNEIAAGVAILLFGMIALERGFKTFAEGPLKKFLKQSTSRFYKSFGLGVISTTILQSSSLISIITISFISAGLLTLVGAIGIIFGANIGTTATAWLVAGFGLKVRISILAMPLLVFGILLIFQEKAVYKGIGNILSGLGFLFLGIYFMKEGFDAFQGNFILEEYAVSGVAGLLLFVGVGILLTTILQSSSATMAIILTALAATQISYFQALALAIGANVGTTITAIIGAMASNPAGRQVAGAHLVFNVVTAVAALIFIIPIGKLVDGFAAVVGIAENNYTLKLAAFHTLFNLFGVLIMYPFVKPLARFLQKKIPLQLETDIEQPIYLNESALMYPQSAISALIKETQHLFENVVEVILHGLNLHKSDVLSGKKLKQVFESAPYKTIVDIDEIYLHKIKTIYSTIIEFATLAQKPELSEDEVKLIYNIKEANRYFIEVVKDLKELQPNIIKYDNREHIVMKKEYDRFRRRICKIIREVYETQSLKVDAGMSNKEKREIFKQHLVQQSLMFEKEENKIKGSDIMFNGTLDMLIADKTVTKGMVSSIINDSAIVARISRNLIEAARLLYLQTDLLIMAELHADEPDPSLIVQD